MAINMIDQTQASDQWQRYITFRLHRLLGDGRTTTMHSATAVWGWM